MSGVSSNNFVDQFWYKIFFRGFSLINSTESNTMRIEILWISWCLICAFWCIVFARNVILLYTFYSCVMLLRSFLHKDENIFGFYLWYTKRQYFFLKFVILLTDLLEIFFHMCLICVSKTLIITWEIGYSPVVYSPILCRGGSLK